MNEEQTCPETETQNAQDTEQPGEKLRPTCDLVEYARQYAREKPTVVALWCLGIGFVLGWKLKPW
jgi:hypothetical protein